ncbi:MAG TPA: ABC transporter permease [Chitinophagaceae bacterium]|nr:ABC transporter permease [Chitinophagaceae bacterium]
MIRTAIKFMRYDRSKSIGIIVGIVISIFLIGQQLGTLSFITEVMGGLMNNANPQSGQIWVVGKATQNVNVLTHLDSRLVREIRSIKGVENTYPIVVANASITLPDGKSSPIVLIGSDAPVFAGGPNKTKIIKGKRFSLTQTNTVSAEYFDAKALNTELSLGAPLEINGKHATIAVETKNAQAFGGHYMYANLNNARFYADFPSHKVSIIAVKTSQEANTQQVVQRINKTFFSVKAWQIDQLKESTIKKLLSTTNMGVSFGTLVIFAIITGFFIIGLTLYSAVLDRLKDYGTFKAIGATNGYVRKLIFTQAILFALIGFIIALGLLIAFKQGVAQAGLIIALSPQLIILLFIITLFISVGGSLFAIRKINKLEPASVFK